MKLKTTFLSIFVLLMVSSVSLADSPLTSTSFSKAYHDYPIVITASQANGVLTPQLMDYLANEYNQIDVKMAVINELGWNTKNKNNAELYMTYLKNKYGYKNEKKFLKKGKKDDLLTMAYLKALDNYFTVTEAVKYAESALKKNESSRTVNLIAGLIRAQQAMDGNWCEVYQITDRVRNNKQLENDMKPEAISIIYEYMDIYQDSCKGT